MIKYNVLLISLLSILLLTEEAFSKAFRVGQLPNGSKLGCISCHNSSNGGDARNPFGREVGTKFLVQGNVQWGPELAKIDSDGDGFTNGQELQDPNGEWKIGNPVPGNPDLVTNPGDEKSKPNVNGIVDAIQSIKDPYYLSISQNLNFSEILINYNLARNLRVTLEVIDMGGNSIRILENAEKTEGSHNSLWDGRDESGATLPNGIYFIRLTSPEAAIIKKFIYLR